MERKAVDNCELFYKKASRINDQTTESSVIVITIIFMIITKIIEISVKYTKLILTLVFSPSPAPLQQLLAICSGLHVCLLKKLSFQGACKRLGYKNVIHGSTCLKEKKILHKMRMLLHLYAFFVTQKFLVVFL